MTDHEHEGFEIPPGKLDGWGVDTALLGQLIGAAYDECPSCQEALLTLLAENAPTTAQLVELACVAVRETLGGIPVDLVDTADADSPVPIGFRRLALSVVEHAGPAALSAQCAGLPATERQATARTATALFVGEMRAAGHGFDGVRRQ
ncbi:hypothetical protein [Nocardia carnea]|uniref:hypothetical protein n=1 Tax=Nocardia carnea TaxID=37328 RepID=UPI002457EB42|nr:hypothetical protein [Nocardia carnea]